MSMTTNELGKFLIGRGWMTINNIMASNTFAASAPQIARHLKSLTVQGKLDVKPGFNSGPRMYRARRTS